MDKKPFEEGVIMHIDATQIVVVASAVVTIASVIASHVAHFKKVAAKIEAIGKVVEKDAPAAAAVVNEGVQVAEEVAQAAK